MIVERQNKLQHEKRSDSAPIKPGTKGAGSARSHLIDSRAGHGTSGPAKCPPGSRGQPFQHRGGFVPDQASRRHLFQHHSSIAHKWPSRRRLQRPGGIAHQWASPRRVFQHHSETVPDQGSRRRFFLCPGGIAHQWASRQRLFQRHGESARDRAFRRRFHLRHSGSAHDCAWRRRSFQRDNGIARDRASRRRAFQRDNGIIRDWASRRHPFQRPNGIALNRAFRRRFHLRHSGGAHDCAWCRRSFRRDNGIAQDCASRRRSFRRHSGIAPDQASRWLLFQHHSGITHEQASCESHCGNPIQQSTRANSGPGRRGNSSRQPHPVHQLEIRRDKTGRNQHTVKSIDSPDQQCCAAHQPPRAADCEGRAAVEQPHSVNKQNRVHQLVFPIRQLMRAPARSAGASQLCREGVLITNDQFSITNFQS